MPFSKGQTGNPYGRPRGTYCGRVQALSGLDKMLALPHNKKRLRIALQKEFRSDPVKFFTHFVIPLLPKHHDISAAGLVPTLLAPQDVVVNMFKTVVPDAKVRVRVKLKESI